ncbi:hypothetical protein C8Q76DRAFT_698383 [Earliella scabrosa]|nr:hypothetical protein C8Q76DRAFT_698383 [Earliella scabrosa]
MPEAVPSADQTTFEPTVKLVFNVVTGEWTGEKELGLYIVVGCEDAEVKLRLPEELSIAEGTSPEYWDNLESLLQDTGIRARLTEEQCDAVDIVVSLYRFLGQESAESRAIWQEFWEQVSGIAQLTAAVPQVAPWNLLVNMIPWARRVAKVNMCNDDALPAGMLARWADPMETGEFDDDDEDDDETRA